MRIGIILAAALAAGPALAGGFHLDNSKSALNAKQAQDKYLELWRECSTPPKTEQASTASKKTAKQEPVDACVKRRLKAYRIEVVSD